MLFQSRFSVTIKKVFFMIKVDLAVLLLISTFKGGKREGETFPLLMKVSHTIQYLYNWSFFELVIGGKSLSSEIMVRRDKGKAAMKSKAIRVKWGERKDGAEWLRKRTVLVFSLSANFWVTLKRGPYTTWGPWLTWVSKFSNF